ncbi:MAG: efflux transporter outer membrane subunit [bacterium]|nr:efflux transporter outer membrane subunit [bacterium]
MLTAVAMALATMGVSGCMVGPDYLRPTAPVADDWIDDGPAVRHDPTRAELWWEVFQDPILNDLIVRAVANNRSLRAAALRVVQSQAQRGIAIGGLYPQTQELNGGYQRQVLSRNAFGFGSTPGIDNNIDVWNLGFDAAWEVDLWGRFRRGIEAADAELLATLADYDDALVSLLGDVAATYVQLRLADDRLAIARANVAVQQDALDIARIRFEAGGTSELDVQQATNLLRDTEATIPQFQVLRRQAEDALCALVGLPPGELADILEPGPIPSVPPTIAVGIPSELLQRRPDIRRAERQLAAASANIGVAKADLFPRLSLSGSVGLSAEQAAELFAGRSFAAVGGPTFEWPIFNYGRLINNVRAQDAAFQALVAVYEDTVLRAQQEVEDALIGYVRGAAAVAILERSVTAANRAVELSIIQYREGATDYTRVLDTQQAKLTSDDRLANQRGTLTLAVVNLYKALGGGWQQREGRPLIPEETKDAMRARTWYGSMLDPAEQEADVDQAERDLEPDRPWSDFRWWWPQW